MVEESAHDDFSPLRTFFAREMLQFPQQTGLPGQAWKFANEMVSAWKGANFTLKEMTKNYEACPEYPIQPGLHSNNPNFRNWFEALSESSLPLNVDPQCLILSTLKYFELVSQSNESSRFEGRQWKSVMAEEQRRIVQADQCTLFVQAIDQFRPSYFHHVTTKVCLMGSSGRKIAKLVFQSKSKRDQWESRARNGDLVIGGVNCSSIPNSRFNWAKDLLKDRCTTSLMVYNLVDGSLSVKDMLKRMFPKASDQIVNQWRNNAEVKFATSKETLEAFNVAQNIDPHDDSVVCLFKRL